MNFLNIWLSNTYDFKENMSMPKWRRDLVRENIRKFSDHQFYFLTDDFELAKDLKGVNIIPYKKVERDFIDFIGKDKEWCRELKHVNIFIDLLKVWMGTKTEFMYFDTDVDLFSIPKFTCNFYPYFGTRQIEDKTVASLCLIYTNNKKDWFKNLIKDMVNEASRWPDFNVSFSIKNPVNFIEEKHYIHCKRER